MEVHTEHQVTVLEVVLDWLINAQVAPMALLTLVVLAFLYDLIRRSGKDCD